MGRGPELTPQMRSRLCELKSQGFSYRKIQQIYPQIPKSTIVYTVQMEKTRDDCKSLRRLGRPPLISEEERQLLYSMLKENPDVRNSDLLAAINHKCGLRSLQKLLQSMNLRKPPAKKMTPNTAQQAARSACVGTSTS